MAVKRGLLSDTDSLFIARIYRELPAGATRSDTDSLFIAKLACEFAVGLPDPWRLTTHIWCACKNCLEDGS